MTSSERRRHRSAPEIVVVDLADAALGALILALTIEHASLEADDDPWRGATPTLRRARHLVRVARRLRAELGRYKLAVDDAIRGDGPDTSPF